MRLPWQRSGLRPGDMVTVQGRWQPDQAGVPVLAGVTGITGIDKAALLSEWCIAIRSVKWVSCLAGLLSVLGMVMLILRLWQWRANACTKETKTWMHQTTKDAPAHRYFEWPACSLNGGRTHCHQAVFDFLGKPGLHSHPIPCGSIYTSKRRSVACRSLSLVEPGLLVSV